MAKRSKGKNLEVEDAADEVVQAEPGVEQILVFVTFAALIVALVVSQMELGSAYGGGFLG